VAKTLPGLWRAEKIQKKTGKAGFDWPDSAASMDNLCQEMTELSDALNGDGDIEDELGDVLFSAVNVARHTGIDPEEALHRACNKFSARFASLEQKVIEMGGDMQTMPPEELMQLWKSVKKAED
jgi:tetrapyrrole methylase family protein/MazG family protein